jgi:hypothetical protein
MTPLVGDIHDLIEEGRIAEAVERLPAERAYPAELGHIVPVKSS